jgi:alkanesulfonate monooxygenase SsuD/methylene tetrahydromethanopterin reductase-like flavin-dependent oxidoreductase (luciferase family)
MMRLVARHADQWNAAWYGVPEDATELADRIDRLRAACLVEGRDPSTLRLTAGILVAFPHLLAGSDTEEPPDEAISGDVDHAATAMAGYANHGVAHLMAHVWPPNAEAVTELARAAEKARRLAAPPMSSSLSGEPSRA